MAKFEYRRSPDHDNPGWPPGVPYIIGNEGCERFSFYGMKSILAVYLTTLYALEGASGTEAQAHATATTHLFITGVYAFPMLGALLADRLLGKYNTILWLSLVYCAGHAVLAFFDTSITGIYVGLTLVALGSGGIKPCVSANVGDQFGRSNWDKVERIFQAFYFIINFGSFFATLLIPWLKKTYGPAVAFGVPGILMGIATVVFWAGRKTYVHAPAQPGGKLGLLDASSGLFLFSGTLGILLFAPESLAVHWKLLIGAGLTGTGLMLFVIRQRLEADDGFLPIMIYALMARFGKAPANPSPPASFPAHALDNHWFFGPAARRFGGTAAEGPLAVLRIISVFAFVSVFWALFDQHSSTWIFQAEQMDRRFDLPGYGSIEVLASQIPAMNPALVMLLIPFVGFVFYPGMEKLGLALSPLKKMTIGMALAGLAYVSVALLQERIDAGLESGQTIHVAWQFIPYFIMTLSEVMVSVTGLEFAYTQAPKRMKSTVMGFWLLTVSFGNWLVAFLAGFEDMSRANFFWTFAALMGVAALIFGIRAAFYTYRDYTQ